MRHDLFRFSGIHVPQAAILISKVRGGTHTGVIYRNGNGGLSLLEFCLGGEIVGDPWIEQAPHVIPNNDDDEIDGDTLQNLASLCRVIANRYRHQPQQHFYGFGRSRHAYIDPVTGTVYLGEGGATCASFVLLVMETARINLVVSGEDWPHRPLQDDPAHERLSKLLERNYPGNLARVQANLPCPRVAPAEVAGAGMCPNPPATQEFAERAASWIMDLFTHNERHGV